jgi:hypothetical protein
MSMVLPAMLLSHLFAGWPLAGALRRILAATRFRACHRLAQNDPSSPDQRPLRAERA